MLLWSAGHPLPRNVVVFLHGWQALPPYVYGDWLRHLAAEGNTIVYPVCQGAATRPHQVLDIALAGIAAGLRAAHADPSAVVSIGHSTGGVIAFDYAALAGSRGLVGPRAVLAVYPGRNPPGGEIPTADLSAIPPSTRLEVIAGPGDPIPAGNAQADALLAGATRVSSRWRSLVSAPYQRSSGPFPVSAAPRRSFWAPADRLIAQARSPVR
jgi:acetyl esterase/lipase